MRTKHFLLVASVSLAMAFTFSCTSSDDGGSDVGSSKSDCIKSELQIKANTLDDVAEACGAIRSEVLAQLSDNVGSCDKNDLSFGKSIGEIMSECDAGEVPVVVSSSGGSNGGSSSSNGSSSSRGSSNGGNSNFASNVPKQLYLEEYPFNGNGEIIMILPWQDEYLRSFIDTLHIGIIQNGQVTIDWPDIDSKYFYEETFTFTSDAKKFSSANISCDGSCPDSVNLPGITDFRIIALLSGKGSCRFKLTSEIAFPTSETAFPKIYYLSGSAKITGTYNLVSESGSKKPTSSSSSSSSDPYCYGYLTYKDCNIVGGMWISDEQKCFSGGGTLVNADYCNNNGITIDNTGGQIPQIPRYYYSYSNNTYHYNINISNGWNIIWYKDEITSAIDEDTGYSYSYNYSDNNYYTSSEEEKKAKWTADNCSY